MQAAYRSAALSLIEERARTRPDAVAVRCKRDHTYAEVMREVADLGARIAASALPGSVVALDGAHALSGVVGILAVARSGCVLLPLDQASPPLHRAAVLRDARPAVLLEETGPGRFDVIPAGIDKAPVGPGAVPAGTAYVVYTSGTTGAPKGVLVSHEALRSRLRGLAEVPGLAAGETIVAMTALSFDICLAELVLPLTVGATLVVAPPAVRADPYEFSDFVERHAPDVVQATPSFWRTVVAGRWSGNGGLRVWCGGEALTSVLAAELLPRCGQLWNLYGPTEATVWATAARVTSASPISLGVALPGTGVALMRRNEAGMETVVGAGGEGEIVLSGAGLATGYLGKDALTHQRFPTLDTTSGRRRCYLTGDRGRYDERGEIEFLGRTDDQVKIRGHRVELSAIEAVLEEHPDVVAAAVLLRDADRPERTAVLAAVAAPRATAGSALREWLCDRLPPSHHPQRIAVRDALPRTTAGKVDRVALLQEMCVHE
ncbi:amino acid adenylation domain-containing protein [Streptomyces sp. NPDC046853]|uniref:amino acid adenylation domain-containing protein n=1 Tax=Streptomyces sp. NPDC046853 TaxID=3154920 RepID=UPI0033D298F4